MFITDQIQTDRADCEITPSALLARLCSGESLSSEDSKRLFQTLVDGDLHDTQTAALLIALKVKGETPEELVGAAQALAEAALPFPRPNYMFADSCGTGGDGSGTINLSTAVAFVAAAAGLPIAKHGNRSVTSRCGSADVLEALGVRLDPDPDVSRSALDEIGICFLFAPQYHPGLRHAGPVRRALKVRTVMNMLGPCVNPARPDVQLLGVADRTMLEPVAMTLLGLGVARALVVHGAGLDEIALHDSTDAIQIRDGIASSVTLSPADAAIECAPLSALSGGGAEENAERLKALLKGRGTAAEAQAVALNAGALLMTAALAADLHEGVEMARAAMSSGEPFRRLQALAEISNG